MSRGLALLALALVATSAAFAQTVYRCGADGRSYAQQPCSDGRAVAVGDARPEAERRDAETQASRQARLAQALERDRLDAHGAPMPPVRIDSRPHDESVASPPSRKDLRAIDRPTKKKRRRRAG